MANKMSAIAGNGAQLEPVTALPADQNPALVYLASLGSDGSRRAMRQALDVIAGFVSNDLASAVDFPWAALRFQHTAAIRARLAEQYSAATANKMISAMRGALKAAWRLGQMTAEDYHTAADVKAVRGGSDEPSGRALTPGELGALLTACADDSGPAGIRDAAIIATMYACGPRRAELVSLDLADFQQVPEEDYGNLNIRHGKGNKRRTVPVNNGALDALKDWLLVRGAGPGPLFVAINKGGRMKLGQRMTSQAIYGMLTKRAAEARIADFSPHDLRRTFISDLLDAGADIATVQKLAGHANVTTTARYDRRGERAKRKAIGLLHVPYQRRRLA